MSSFPKTYKALVIEKKGGELVLKNVPLKMPAPGQVLVKTLACGVCHSDAATQQGHMGDVFPRIPGHEIVGDVVAVGDGEKNWKVGDRVGGAWHGGHDGTCRSCKRGYFQMCNNKKVNGVSMDGGYAEYVLLNTEAVVSVPKELDPAEVAPLLCAGITVFNSIRKQNIQQGDTVAIQGLGGLGHLALQFANRMGYRVVALSSGSDKVDFAKKLGAHDYIDTSKDDPVKKLTEMGGASLIVCTAPNPKAIAPLAAGLATAGKLLILAPCGPVPVDTGILVGKGASVTGWPSGHSLDSEETIAFAQVHGVKCMSEYCSLEDAPKAWEHMLQGKVRFRGVLKFY